MPDGLQVVLNGGLRVVTSLELVEHRLAEMGHRNLLVTHTLPALLGWSSAPHAERPPRQRLRSNDAVATNRPHLRSLSLGGSVSIGLSQMR